MRTFEQYSKKIDFRRRVLGKKTGAWKDASLARLSWDKTWTLLTVAS